MRPADLGRRARDAADALESGSPRAEAGLIELADAIEALFFVPPAAIDVLARKLEMSAAGSQVWLRQTGHLSRRAAKSRQAERSWAESRQAEFRQAESPQAESPQEDELLNARLRTIEWAWGDACLVGALVSDDERAILGLTELGR